MKNHVVFFICLIGTFIVVFCLAAQIPEELVKSSAEMPAVIISPSSVGEVSFPHQQHFEDFELDCEECHHEINAAKLKTPHEHYFDDFWIECKICHHQSGAVKLEAQACSNCHHASPSSIADETLSSTVVIHKNCWECHEVGTGQEASSNCKLCHAETKPDKE